jgi:hypothetical protein
VPQVVEAEVIELGAPYGQIPSGAVVIPPSAAEDRPVAFEPRRASTASARPFSGTSRRRLLFVLVSPMTRSHSFRPALTRP